ncbi:HutD family protein [Komagataeibacter sp. FNDCR2]|uniref:HutD/Ves family protein n=1 Tax=Komagataeibacter sp. FNDCR2 TaxID=2878682 RepID=UPI001E3415B4|nr:HutD family protein [Komagataeibacter sp. FNDCR2]MCE2574140.1 HutD family protein [Komagataeibacter sp. FNDCR2]
MLTLTTLDAFAPQPWRNGRGTTRQIMAHDAHASPSPHFWRVSLACIECDGPFSLFPGLVRQLALASPGKLTLEGIGTGGTTLGHPGEIIRFDGAAPVTASCHGRSVLAFNLMAAPAVPARLERHRTLFRLEHANTVALLPLQGEWRVEGCDRPLPTGMIAYGHTNGAITVEPVAPRMPACLIAAIISTSPTEKVMP